MVSRWFGRKLRHFWPILVGSMVALVPPARADGEVAGAWDGHYRCGQGNTALRLILRSDAGGLDGLFYFHETADNPGVPEGCFAMSGSFDAQSRRVGLSAGRWLLRPFGYVTVDLDGRLDPAGSGLSGQVIGPLCTDFELHLTKRGVVAIPPACQGAATVAAVGP